jgi:hypothetical protein
MQSDVDGKLMGITQSLVTIHRAQAKELSTGTFSTGLKSLLKGGNLDELALHVEECNGAIMAITNLHQQRIQILESAITELRSRQPKKRPPKTTKGRGKAEPLICGD